MTRARRPIAGVVVALATAAGLLFARVALPLINVATGYKAKALCSEVFVAGRSPNDVVSGSMVDDLGALRLIAAAADTTHRTASARLFPFATRVARYDESFGCVLSPRGAAAATNTARRPDIRPSTAPSSPARDSVEKSAITVDPALAAVLDDAFAEPDPTRPRRTRAIVVV
jgi:hypothetical protein